MTYLLITSSITFSYLQRMFKRTQFTRLLSSLHDSKNKTAGILVIGDEILKGDIVDTNSHYVAKKLHDLGIKVAKISVIGDNVDEICNEVKTFSDNFDYVITSGGIGPTHDDVTFEAIGKAFKEPLYPNPTLVDICAKFYKTRDLTAPGMKLAFIPKSAKLTFDASKMNYPNISVKNVYVFPGIPELFVKSVDALANVLFKSDCKFHTKVLYFNVTENILMNTMDVIVKTFPEVSVGSYPELFNTKYKVKVCIESTEKNTMEAAYSMFLNLIPREFIVSESKL